MFSGIWLELIHFVGNTKTLKQCQNVTIYLTQINHDLIDSKQLVLIHKFTLCMVNWMFTRLFPMHLPTWNCGNVPIPDIVWSWCWNKQNMIISNWKFSKSNTYYLFTWSISMYTRNKIYYFYLNANYPFIPELVWLK